MRKMNRFVCVVAMGGIMFTQMQLSVLANGLFDGLKDVASDAAKEVLDDVVSDAANEIWEGVSSDVVEFGSSLLDDWEEEWGESAITDLYADVKSWMEVSGESALESLENIFMMLTAKMGMEEDEAATLWNSIMDFANENDIDSVVLAKLSISALVSNRMEDGFVKEQADDYIKETIWGWIENSVIGNQEEAEEALKKQEEILEQTVKEALEELEE